MVAVSPLFASRECGKMQLRLAGKMQLSGKARRGKSNPVGGFEMAKKALKKGKKLAGTKSLGGRPPIS